jgi:hypothetical protein
LAREAYLEAIEASFHAGRFAPVHYVRQVAVAAQEAAPLTTSSRPIDLLLDGLATRFTLGYEASVPGLQRALESLGDDSSSTDDHGRLLWLGCHVGVMLWDDEVVYVLASRAVRIAREAGALATLPAALNVMASALVGTGQLGRAAELLAEEEAITRATGAPPHPNARLGLSAWRVCSREPPSSSRRWWRRRRRAERDCRSAARTWRSPTCTTGWATATEHWWRRAG